MKVNNPFTLAKQASPQQSLLWMADCTCCTLRSGLHEVSTMIRTFPHGLENTHACKWISDNFPGMLIYVLFLEKFLKFICIHGCSPIHAPYSREFMKLAPPPAPANWHCKNVNILKSIASGQLLCFMKVWDQTESMTLHDFANGIYGFQKFLLFLGKVPNY